MLIGGGYSMQTIKYKFADGTTNEVEVTEEIYLIHLELLQQEKRNHWKETGGIPHFITLPIWE